MKDYEDEPVFENTQTLHDTSQESVHNFFDSNSPLQGKIYLVSEGCVCAKLPSNAKAILNAARAVFRLFVIYKTLDSKVVKTVTGTAFAISPNALLTASHCVRPSYIDETLSETLFLSNIYADHSSCTREFVFDTSHPNVNEVKIIDRTLKTDSNHDKNSLQSTDDETYWKHTDDFCLLHFIKYQHHSYIQKVSPSFNEKVYLIGYPSDITIEKFLEDYTNKSETIEKCSTSLWYRITRAMGHFETMIISEGTANVIDDTQATHNCLTLKGTCGGVLLNSCGEMIGIHVGGGCEINYNYWIPITDKHLDACLSLELLD